MRLVALFACLLPTPLLAQCYPQRATYVPYKVVKATPVVAAIPVPVLVPAFSFQYVAPPAVNVTVQQTTTTVSTATIGTAATAVAGAGATVVGTGVVAAPVVDMPPPVVFPGETPPTVAANPAAAGGGHVEALQRNCASCHTAPGKRGVVLFEAGGAFAPNVSPEAVAESVLTGRMPPGKEMSWEDKRAIVRWK